MSLAHHGVAHPKHFDQHLFEFLVVGYLLGFSQALLLVLRESPAPPTHSLTIYPETPCSASAGT